jgi:hypothetical protein
MRRPPMRWLRSPKPWARLESMNDQDNQSQDALEARLAELRQDHADLDAAVQAISLSPLPDMMLIARLKRKKLALKDEISRIEDQLTPDIIA